MTRSNRTGIAAIFVFVYCLAVVIRFFIAFATQNELLQSGGYGVAALGLIVFSFGLASAYGIWQNQKWGKITAIVILALNAILALPGILFTTTFAERVEPLGAVLVAIAVIILLLWPAPRNSLT